MSSNKIPLVSIGLIVFNGENYLREALDGLIVQDYENFELLISDNASTDSTKDICEEYARIDKRIKYSRNTSNLGGANSSKVLEMARGEFFMWAAHDDNWDKSYVSKCVAKLQEFPKAVMCSSEITFIDSKGIPLVHGGYGTHVNLGSRPGMAIQDRVRELISRVGWFAFYGVWRTDAIRKINFLSDTIQGYGSDVLLLQYMILVGDFVKVEEKLFYYRVADKEKTTEDYLLQIHGTKPVKVFKAYTYLAKELYKIILDSDLDQQTKSIIRDVFLITLSSQNDDWFGRITREFFPQGFRGGLLEKKQFIERYVLRQAELEYSNILAERKKVLVFFPHNIMPPQNGAHKRCLDLLLSLRAAGHEVTLVGSTLFSDNPWQKESIEKLKTEHGINVLLHQGIPEDRAYIQSYNPDLDWRYFTPPSLVQFFMKVYDTLHPEIVYINYALWAGLVEDKRYDASVLIIEMHDMITSNQKMQNYARSVCNNPASLEIIPPEYIDEGFYGKIDTAPSLSEFKAYNRFDIVTAIAPTEAALVAANTSRPEVVTLPHVFKANYRENTYNLSPVFVIGNNLFNFQGYAYFVKKILPIIREKYPDFVLRVVGGGCKHLRQVPGIELLGFVPDLSSIYKNASFAICPLIGGTGQQIKIVEAMSYGVPVVALANVSTNSPIVNEINGFVAENAEEFASYMVMLLNDKELCRKLGEAARQTIFEAHFKNKNNAVLIESIKRKLNTDFNTVDIHNEDLAQIDQESEFSKKKFNLTKKTKSIKIAGEDKGEKDLTQIDSVSEFAIQLNRVIKEYKPKKLLETGTYLGMGTTSVVTSALKENGLEDSQFFSIEVKSENHLAAKKNLTENGLINYVTLLNGISMPRKALPTIEEIERTTVKEVEFEGIYIDHQESERARLYYNETNYDDVEEDLIGKCLITFESEPDFVLLDSGGHMGNLEFNYLIERLEKECIVALDDVNHIKHRKSYMQIQNDSRFELITSSDEKFGFCIAKFTPVKDKILPIQPPIKIHPKKILFIRTDAVGDNVLASVILRGIKEKFPKADITVICNELVADLYKYSPYIKNVIGFNRSKFENDDEYKGRLLANLKAQKYDLAINSIYSSDQIVDIILFTAGAKQTIRIDGNGENFTQQWKWVNSANARATHVIRTGAGWRSEIERHKDFLHGLGVNTTDIKPEMWLSKEDEEFAEKVFSDNGLTPEKTIVLFAGAKYDLRVYAHFGKSLSKLCKENGYSVIALGSSSDEKINQDNLDEIDSKTINLSGKTTLRQTAAIIKKCRLAVGAETGNAHIACAVGTPNVIIIGGGHFGRFMPYSGLTSLVTLPMDCYGCNWVCKYERTHCVKDIDTEVLSKAVEDVLLNTSQNPKIYFNELPDDKSRKLFGKMLSRFISLDKVELKEVKGNQDSTYSKTILYLAEEAIEANQPDKAKKLLHNILSFDPENVDALNNFAVAEIIAENWENALNILLKVIEIDPANDVALGNFQFLKEKFISGKELLKDSANQENQVLTAKEDAIPRSAEIKLSAIVSVYNAERFIRGCMEDLTAQTIYKRGEMEIIIVETGSQQNEKIIINEYVKNYPNINYIRIPERETVYQAWNRGVRAARGKYLTNANADDRHRVNGLEMLVNLLEKNPDKALAYGNSVVSEIENDTFENCTVAGFLNFPEFNKMTMLERCYIGPHPVWKKSLHDEFGYFDESLKSAADYEFWLRIAEKYEFIHLNELVGVYWRNDNSVSRAGDTPVIEENAVKEKYRNIYEEQFTRLMNAEINSTDKPFFTIVVPVYNHGAYIGFALDSIINQTFTNWEAVVVNDGSTDNTPEVIEEYAKKDSRIRCFHKENGGVSTALNEGIKNAKGEWICWLSSDDLFEPDKLAVHYKRMQEKPDKKFQISMWSLLLEETGMKYAAPLWNTIPANEFRVLQFFFGNYVHGNSVSVHKSVFEKVGLFNPKLRQGQDFDMWLRVADQFEIEFIQYRTCVTRIHPGQDTAGFVEGGKLDSCRSLIHFANSKKFEELFKNLDLTKYENAKKALIAIISITLREEAFIHRIGPSSILIDLARHWLTNDAPPEIKKQLEKELPIIIKEMRLPESSKSFLPIVEKLFNKGKYTFKPHSLIKTAEQNIKLLIQRGDHSTINDIERFLMRGFKLQDEMLAGEKEYQPVLYGLYENREYIEAEVCKFSKWFVFPHPTSMDKTHHRTMQICSKCGKVFNYNFDLEYSKELTEHKYLCPFCKQGYKLNEDHFRDHIYCRIKKISKPSKRSSKLKPRIAFLMKATNYVGGGNKIVLKHIEWLNQLGAETIIYSFDKKPDWTDIKANYKQIKNYNEINNMEFDYIIIFSVFDIPVIISRIHPSKVALLCQGYEGYHYGSDYKKIRADKYLLDVLHSFPVKNIVVSTHLKDLFKQKFGSEALYIPNSIDHNIFKPSNLTLSNRNKSIVFIGNPFHILKGARFFLTTIRGIQNSKYRIKGLSVEFVFGFQPEDIEGTIKEFSQMTNASVNIHVRLNPEQVYKLISESKLLVCTSMYEGFSLPIMEAMAAGTPVITTSNMGAESFCKNGYNSSIVDYENYDDFGKNILQVFNNDPDVEKRIQNGIKTALEYNDRNSFEHLVNEYSKLIGFEFDPDKIDATKNQLPQIDNIGFKQRTNAENNFDKTLIDFDPVKIVEQAEAFIEEEEYEQAKQILTELLDKAPDYIDALNDLAVINIVENKFVEALQLINRVLSIDPENEIALGNFQYINEKTNESGQSE